MTTARWVRDLLQSEWDEDNQWREEAVPQPEIIVEGDETRRSAHHRDYDVIFTKDGGLPTIDPQSIGYREEYVEATIDVEIITSDSRAKLLGQVSDTYGGLSGEVNRIIHKYRTGMESQESKQLGGFRLGKRTLGHPGVADPGYDVIRVDTFDDEIGARGADIWAGTWTITFITYASQIAQDAANRA